MTPKRITPTSLDNAALFYLQRFASSAANLRRVLLRRIDKAARLMEDEEAAETLRTQGSDWVDALIERYRSSGLLDDATYAEARARSLHRRGAPLKAIAYGLRTKGVDADTASETLDRLREEHPDADLSAALAFARRRRLGPFRPAELRAQHRDKDLATMGRAGFSYELARKVVEREEEE